MYVDYFSAALERVLQKNHEYKGYKLEISDKPVQAKPVPKKRKCVPGSEGEEVKLLLSLL